MQSVRQCGVIPGKKIGSNSSCMTEARYREKGLLRVCMKDGRRSAFVHTRRERKWQRFEERETVLPQLMLAQLKQITN